MKLNEFLTSSGTSMGSFGRTVGATTATISRIADGTVVPRKSLMKRIHLVTGGLVTPNDLVGLYCVQPCGFVAQIALCEDSLCESSVVAGGYEQLDPYEVQDPELGRV